MRLLICAGGTGGGVYPAVTVAQALKIDPDNLLWVGSQGGMEEALVKRLHIPFTSIPAAGVHGIGLKKLPGNLFKLFKGYLASRKILKEFRPDVLLFTGGYVAIPMAVAALRKPAVLYVPDIEPGLALKFLARFADKIALTTKCSEHFFPNQEKLTMTGYPIREDLKKWDSKTGRAYFRLEPNLRTLLFMGGSSGARSINYALLDILPELLKDFQIIHLTGHLDWEAIQERTQNLSSHYQAFPYLHEVGAALAAADLVISRAGASTLGEYPLFGLPAILVPYPYAWHYQKVNAEYLVKNNAAVMIRDEALNEELLPTIRRLMHDPEELNNMRKAMASLAHSDAAGKIAELIQELAGVC